MSSHPNEETVQELFDRIAPVYDELNQQFSLGLHHIWKQMAVKWADPQPGNTVLDLCCGSGDLAQRLAKAVGMTGHVYGVDFSSAQLAIAQQRSQVLHLPTAITWTETDVLNLPFAENFFDAATMGYGLRNVVDIPRSLQELYRVLKPMAKAAILDFNHPSHPWVQQFQQWYLDSIVVPTAQRLGVKAEYAYIAPSLERFPTGFEQITLAQAAGFTCVTHYPIAAGTMGVLVVTKP
jgi:demethylmenaquinone methyltransferase/2-methoxy-6-polyprenyl-1,4-benzoquinol methylase